MILSAENPSTTCVHLEEDAMLDPDIHDNSDDDVIEVVRDEAPIEILSDGEELEIQLQQSQDALENIAIENIQMVLENRNSEEKEKEDKNTVSPAEDPLKDYSHNSFCSDLLDALNPTHQPDLIIENTLPTETEFNTKISIDSRESNTNDNEKNITSSNEITENVTNLDVLTEIAGKNDEPGNSNLTDTILSDDGPIGDLKI